MSKTFQFSVNKRKLEIKVYVTKMLKLLSIPKIEECFHHFVTHLCGYNWHRFDTTTRTKQSISKVFKKQLACLSFEYMAILDSDNTQVGDYEIDDNM